MSQKWLIIGICGVTCGGKTTLSTQLSELIPDIVMISQDDYFLDVNDPRHTWIPELQHINFDIVSGLDIDRMYADVIDLIKSVENCAFSVTLPKKCNTFNDFKQINDLVKHLQAKLLDTKIKVLILEGFCIFNCKLADLCYLKYYLTLTKEECYKRRLTRIYDPPDVPGYFEKCVWPEHLNLFDYVTKNVRDVKYIDGTLPSPVENILIDLLNVLIGCKCK